MMYHKFIGDREVFSDCKTIRMDDGTVICNPSAEQIAAAGWEVYVPPIVPSQPELEPSYEDVIAAVKKILASDTTELSDEDALDIAALYPTWASKVGDNVAVGERLWYDGKLYKVIQAHTATELWTPALTPALYTEISIVEWPEWRQPLGSEDAYHLGDKVSHNDKHWVSVSDNNTWEPGVYGWELRA